MNRCSLIEWAYLGQFKTEPNWSLSNPYKIETSSESAILRTNLISWSLGTFVKQFPASKPTAALYPYKIRTKALITTLPTRVLSSFYFEILLSSHQMDQIRQYIDTLLQWNQNMNLTAVNRGEWGHWKAHKTPFQSYQLYKLVINFIPSINLPGTTKTWTWILLMLEVDRLYLYINIISHCLSGLESCPNGVYE